MKQFRFKNLILFLYLFFCVWGIKSVDESNTYIYLLTVLVSGYTILHIFSTKYGKLEMPCRYEIVMMVTFVLTYIYGIILGFIRGNEQQYVLRNFAGMVLYLACFIIANLDLKMAMVKKFVKYMGITLTILTPTVYCLVFVVWKLEILNIPIINSFQTGVQDWGYTLEYYGIVMLFASYAYAMYQVMYYSKYRYCLLMGLEAFLICFLTLSGGRVLELIALTFFGVLGLAKSKRSSSNRIIVIVMFVLAVFTIPIIAIWIFGRNDGGNQDRYRQIDFILHNLSFWGKGLGATYKQLDKGYGIETVYLDLIYKLGIFALPIYVIYISSFFMSYNLLSKSEGDWIDIMPITFMGYLWYSFGNPNLFSGGNIILHIVSLEIISARKRERLLKNEDYCYRH